MIILKNNTINITCMKCGKTHKLTLIDKGIEKFQRSIGFEYLHSYTNSKVCECGELMTYTMKIYEYPKTIINSIDKINIACLTDDKIIKENDTVNIVNVDSTKKNKKIAKISVECGVDAPDNGLITIWWWRGSSLVNKEMTSIIPIWDILDAKKCYLLCLGETIEIDESILNQYFILEN